MKRAIIVGALVVAIGVVFALKQKAEKENPSAQTAVLGETPSATPAAEQTGKPVGRPRLIELGSEKCVPCRMMAPILDELRQSCAGRLEIEFCDVWKDPQPAQQYGIRVIPTQIFLAPDGRELFRHEGFFPKEEILKKWRDLGYDLEATGAAVQ